MRGSGPLRGGVNLVTMILVLLTSSGHSFHAVSRLPACLKAETREKCVACLPRLKCDCFKAAPLQALPGRCCIFPAISLAFPPAWKTNRHMVTGLAGNQLYLLVCSTCSFGCIRATSLHATLTPAYRAGCSTALLATGPWSRNHSLGEHLTI